MNCTATVRLAQRIMRASATHLVRGLECLVRGLECLVRGLECLVRGLECLVRGLECLVRGLECLVQGLECLVRGLECLVPESVECGFNKLKGSIVAIPPTYDSAFARTAAGAFGVANPKMLYDEVARGILALPLYDAGVCRTILESIRLSGDWESATIRLQTDDGRFSSAPQSDVRSATILAEQ